MVLAVLVGLHCDMIPAGREGEAFLGCVCMVAAAGKRLLGLVWVWGWIWAWA